MAIGDCKAPQFHDIGEYDAALSKFVEPNASQITKNDQGFTCYHDPLIEEYFEYVANHGRTELTWSVVRDAFRWKLATTIKDMMINYKRDDDEITAETSNEEDKEIERMTHFILTKSESFEDAPFTIQRLCELLTFPDKHYNQTAKYLRALERTINVVSCVTHDGRRTVDVNGVDLNDSDDDVDEEAMPRVESAFMMQVDELDAPISSKMALSKEADARKVSSVRERIHSFEMLKKENAEQQKDGDDTKMRVEMADTATKTGGGETTIEFQTYDVPLGPILPSDDSKTRAPVAEVPPKCAKTDFKDADLPR